MSRIPRNAIFPVAQLYNREYIAKRVDWLERKTKVKLQHIKHFSEDPENMRGNVENLIGVAQVPLGIVGPLRIEGDHARGDFYVPLATTEGALVLTYHRGSCLLTESGGVQAAVLRDSVHISPIFSTGGLRDSLKFMQWVRDNFINIKKEAEKNHQSWEADKRRFGFTGQERIIKIRLFYAGCPGVKYDQQGY